MPKLAREAETLSFASAGVRDELPFSIDLELVVRDRDVIRALVTHEEGEQRDAYALEALKIGVLALRHVGGYVNVDLIQRECTRLMENLAQTLEQHTRSGHDRMTTALKEYFDPESGRFNERVSRLVSDDGELTQLLRSQLDGEDSRLARTLFAHVGSDSPLMKLLDPNQSKGLLCALRETVEAKLAEQREQVLREFSLDNDQGALARLIKELNTQHGDLSKELQEKIDVVVKEFSLDEENSALSRLVKNVERAQRTINSEFSFDNEESAFSRLKAMLEATQGAIHGSLTLDDDGSPLARLKRELMTIHEAQVKTNAEFQQEVKVSLAKLVATRAEAERSTRHGVAFEDAVCDFVLREAQRVGDVAIPTGSSVGMIKNCKVGDCVIELGPDSPAPGAKIVVEAKESASYNLAKAREELETARKNRGAEWGLFVFSKKSAHPGWEPLQRYGHDIVVMWDAEDIDSDVFLRAGITIARGLSIQRHRCDQAQAADFDAIDCAILEIEKRAKNLEDVGRCAETIQKSSEKIIDRVRKDRKALGDQVEILRERITELKEL